MKDIYLSNEQANRLVEMAKAHNASIDHFINVTLREYFGSDTVNASQWFEAQRLINQQNFYDKGHTILVVLRTIGIDCKMDMQSNKLVCPELGI